MVIRAFENRLERMVEGTFARAFKSGLRPVELGRRLTREMDADRSVDVNGNTIVPNEFRVWLSAADIERFAAMSDRLTSELCEAAREHARDEGYRFIGPVRVSFAQSDRLHTGTFSIEAELAEGEGGIGAGSLILPTRQRVPLGERPLSIGRLPECNITLNDPNVSRHHAEIRPQGNGFVIVDQGSTNGVKVNGVRVSQQVLVDGDQITIGNTRMVFEAS
ncbi:MAG: DUF3662 domain-containing protein [Microthrixaceae bacterium]|nr:DUF3662 domain-containing protein [Microthrixaceae bacterium]